MAISAAEETDIKTAILYAMGVPMKEIAARLNRKEMTLYKRRMRMKELHYDWIEKLVESELERRVAMRVQKIQEHADIKARIKKKSYEKLEKLVDRDETDMLLLGSVKEGLERTEGKSLDRRAILQRNEQVTRTEIGIDDLEEFFAEVKKLNQVRQPPMLNAVPEAEIVPSQQEAQLVGSPG